eukprot:TRINITY_DN1700_c1_g2_i1.p2 TRINITY_DN1700_c1_g2~~TRINITY_DN1700_c1_g2_i1.p2  ORF type:complete len:103 (-),score=11.30 TRINITY_DN1700_c1_g2_i1:30-338(-)
MEKERRKKKCKREILTKDANSGIINRIQNTKIETNSSKRADSKWQYTIREKAIGNDRKRRNLLRQVEVILEEKKIETKRNFLKKKKRITTGKRRCQKETQKL